MYPIIDLTGKPARLASDPKKDLSENYWVKLDKYTKVLFKYNPRKTYSHYGEKMSYEILCLLGIDCARVELARMGDKVGCISYNFLKRGEENFSFGDIADSVDINFNIREDYSVNYILGVLSKLKSSQYQFDFGKEKIFEMIAGDLLIANTDRHVENFSAVIDKKTGRIKRTSPLFDFGFTVGLSTHPDVIRKCLIDENVFQRESMELRPFIEPIKRVKFSYPSYADFLLSSFYVETEEFMKKVNKLITSKTIDEILSKFDEGLPVECKEFSKRIVMDRRNYLVDRYFREKLVRESNKMQSIEGNGFNRILKNVGEHARTKDLGIGVAV